MALEASAFHILSLTLSSIEWKTDGVLSHTQLYIVSQVVVEAAEAVAVAVAMEVVKV